MYRVHEGMYTNIPGGKDSRCTASDAGQGCFKFKLPIFLQVQLKGGLGGGEWDYALARTASDIRVRPQGCRPLAADAPADSELRANRLRGTVALMASESRREESLLTV